MTHHLEGGLNPSGAGSDYRRYFHHRRGHPAAPAAGQRGRLAVIHLLAAPARSARIGADRHARAALRRLPRRVGDAPDHGRRARRCRSVRDGVHHVRAVGAHVRASDAAGFGCRTRATSRRPRRGAGDGPELRQLLRPLLGERGGGRTWSTTAWATRIRARAVPDAQRFFELTDTHLTLRPPVATDDEGREVQSTILWARISD